VIRYAAVVAFALALSPACGNERESTESDAEADQSTEALREQLEQLLATASSTDQLEVIYDDMHGFHGGETLTVKSNVLSGKYLFRNEVSPSQIEPPPIIMTARQMGVLVQLLLEIEAWEQRVPHREAGLDESAATLSIKVGAVESYIWEWYNDLHGNNRMVRVKQLLEEIVGPILEGPSDRER
jgi:hypothetical protein